MDYMFFKNHFSYVFKIIEKNYAKENEKVSEIRKYIDSNNNNKPCMMLCCA